MLNKSEIKNRLETIYAKIPNGFPCRHCHECCGPIIWFKPEDILIRDYIESHNIEYMDGALKLTKKNNLRCLYLQKDRCSIYPVRPIVCRLQGHIPELPCKYNKNKVITKHQLKEIKREFDTLVKDTEGIGTFYGPHKFTKLL